MLLCTIFFLCTGFAYRRDGFFPLFLPVFFPSFSSTSPYTMTLKHTLLVACHCTPIKVEKQVIWQL
jgi:hypothetical protein